VPQCVIFYILYIFFQFLLQLVVNVCRRCDVDQTSRAAQEAADSVFPFLHAQASELLKETSKHERHGTHQGTIKEVRRTFRTQEGGTSSTTTI